MDWKWLFLSFQGRINRQPFWLGYLALIVVSLIVNGIAFGMMPIDAMQSGMMTEEQAMQAMALPTLVSSLVGLLMLWPNLAITVKRWHDRGKSGWWTLILFVPVIGFLWFLIELGFLRGTPGPNAYGPDPLGY